MLVSKEIATKENQLNFIKTKWPHLNLSDFNTGAAFGYGQNAKDAIHVDDNAESLKSFDSVIEPNDVAQIKNGISARLRCRCLTESGNQK